MGCIPPAIAEAEDPDNAAKLNLRCLRHTATVNHYNGCAISLPCETPGEAPVGLMLCAKNGGDEKLYRLARSVEHLLDPSGQSSG